MKIFFTTVLFNVFFFNLAFSQVTINSNFGYVPGDYYTIQQCSTSTSMPSAAGANVNVNYAVLTNSGDPVTANYVAASSTPSFSDFPGSTVATVQNGSTIYYKNATASIEFTGIATPNYNMVYVDPQILFKFPTNFNDAYSDNFRATYAITGSFDAKRSGVITSLADAYGNITTPTGTFPYLRVKLSQTIYDSIFIQGNLTQVALNTSVTYNYINPNFKAPVFYYNESTNSQGTFKSANYYVSGSTGVNEVKSANEKINVYPNPAHDKLYVTINNSSASKFKIFDATGKLMDISFSTELSSNLNTLTLNISSLSLGLYSLVVESENGDNYSSKFMVK